MLICGPEFQFYSAVSFCFTVWLELLNSGVRRKGHLLLREMAASVIFLIKSGSRERENM